MSDEQIMSPAFLLRVPWRTGRKVGRTVYAQAGIDPGNDDELIGVMDSRELAEAVVRAHNRAIGLDPLLMRAEEEPGGPVPS